MYYHKFHLGLKFVIKKETRAFLVSFFKILGHLESVHVALFHVEFVLIFQE